MRRFLSAAAFQPPIPKLSDHFAVLLPNEARLTKPFGRNQIGRSSAARVDDTATCLITTTTNSPSSVRSPLSPSLLLSLRARTQHITTSAVPPPSPSSTSPSIQRLQLGEHNAAAVFKLLTTPSHKLISTQRLTSVENLWGFYQRRFGRRQANPAANLSKQRPRHFNLDALVVDAMLEFKPPAGKTHVSKPKAAYVCHAFDIIGISPASA
ncbi:hypothetical protein R3P38DRAFT_3563968 [Favolaschia claudopus]|uniref:Uncharacterized protein n=1 Tax=Favolaschia claudopus TaxID=2862362 RepID=A0AAW0DVX5_9AGAR